MIVKGSGKIIASGSTGESYAKVFGNGNVYASNLDTLSYSEQIVQVPVEKGRRRSALRLHE
jgi:hypothetical protein